MKQPLFVLSVFLYTLPIHGYKRYDMRKNCVDGIYTDISEFTFEGSSPDDYYYNFCTNELGVKSICAAAKVYCTGEEIESGFTLLNGYCTTYGMTTMTPYEDVLPALTDDVINNLLVVDFEDIDPTKIWNESVLVSRDFWIAGARTTGQFSKEYDRHHIYGYALMGFWAGVLVIGTIYNLIQHLYQSRPTENNKDLESTSGTTAPRQLSGPPRRLVFSPIIHAIQTNFIVPAAFGSHHQRLFYGVNIPTRIEAVVVTAFYTLTLVLCCIGYEAFWPNIYYTEAMQIARYVADRTAIIAYSVLPVLWMFSGRNNVFLWLTGWSFQTFNVFHRHVARVAVLTAITHSVAWTVLEINSKGYTEDWKEQYWYMGAIGMVSMSLILLFSNPWLRKKSYEVFLILHIVMSVLVVVGLFYHTKIFDGEYDGYLWPLVAIWSFDRVARFVRLAYCNVHLRTSGGAVGTTTTATYSPDAGLIRLEITPKSRLLKPGPGQHYFVYQPLKWKGWENHPFTLATWEAAQPGESQALDTNTNPLNSDAASANKEIQVLSSSNSTTSISPSPSQLKQDTKPSTTGHPHKLTFLIRPFDGWTKRLRNECLKTNGPVLCPKVFLEGPYGEPSPLHRYENVLLIAGGSGITSCIAYLQDHVSRAQASMTATRAITLVWTTKQSAMITDIAARELKDIITGRADVHLSLHATSRKESPRTVSVASADLAKQVSISNENHGDSDADADADELNISYGRPDVHAIIDGVVDDVHGAGAAGGRIAVLTCGPAGLADESRAAVHQAMKRGRRVAYIEESFGWDTLPSAGGCPCCVICDMTMGWKNELTMMDMKNAAIEKMAP